MTKIEKFLLLFCFFIIVFCSSCNKDMVGVEDEPNLLITSSHDSGFYSEEFKLFLSANKESLIYYTLDGSEPTKDSLIFNNGITINNASVNENVISNIENISSLDNVYFPSNNVDKCTILKAKAYSDDNSESETFTFIYFVGLNNEYYNNIPIICLYTDYNNLFDYEYGIYVTGKTYDEGVKEGYPETYPANYNNTGKNWERETEIFFFNNNHSMVNSQMCGIRIHGGWTRAFNQKSFNVYARKEYEDNKFNIELFDNINPKTFMLRSGGYRDSYITKVRDAMNQTLCSNLGFETQEAYPCILFLNGEYWGIYDIQERFSDSFIEEHYGIDKDNVIIIEKDELDEGIESDIELYNSMVDYFKHSDLSLYQNYEYASEILDIDGFINYMCCELIIGNVDWPYNNFRFWRSRESGENLNEDCKWRLMFYDTDDSCGIIEKCSVDSNPFINLSHWKSGPLDDGCTIGIIFSSLMENNYFKTQFINSFHNILENVLNKSNVEDYLNRQILLLKLPMEKHYQRFVSSNNEEYNSSYFEDEVLKIINFYENRSTYLLNYLNELN